MTPNVAGRSVLVTGATGFTGSRIVRALMLRGDRVHVLVRPSSYTQIWDSLPERPAVHVHDGTTRRLMDIVGAAAPDVVFHLASFFCASHTPDDIVPMFESNLVFGAQLLEASAQSGVKRWVNTGTSWQHYRDADYSPVCLYAATKQAFEDIIQFYVETAGLKAVTLDLFDTYGPDDPRPKLLGLLEKTAATGVPLEMSPGEQLIDLVHIDDVVSAFIAAEELLFTNTCAGHEHFSVSSGAPLTLRDIVRLAEGALGRPVPVRFGAREYRPREVMIPWSRGRKLPGWSPRTDIETGLRQVFRKARTHEG